MLNYYITNKPNRIIEGQSSTTFSRKSLSNILEIGATLKRDAYMRQCAYLTIHGFESFHFRIKRKYNAVWLVEPSCEKQC